MKTNESKTKQPPKLYRVWSVIPRFKHGICYYKDVHISWCVEKREKPPIPYRDGVKDYETSKDKYKQYCEVALDELFTEAEANVFKAYLLSVYNDETVQTSEAELPIDSDSYLTTGEAGGGGLDVMAIYKDPSYCLSFKVGGLFDIRGDKPIEEEDESKEDKCRYLFEHMAVHESIRHEQTMKDILALKKLKEDGNLKLKIVRGYGYFEFPCDICGTARETGHVYNLALDLPKDMKLHRRLSNFVCSECSKEIAPDLQKTLEELREKVDASLQAEHELYEMEESIPSIVAERKKAQAQNESEHEEDKPF